MKLPVKYTLKHVFTALFLAFSIGLFAEEHTEHSAAETHGHSEQKFDAGKMIMEHILDAHDWHLWGEHHSAVSIPLPVILYTDKGLDVFMSSAFHHGEATVIGKYSYRLKDNKIVVVNQTGETDEAASAKVLDFSITKNVAALFISIILLLTIFLPVAKRYKENANRAPSGIQSLLEPIILFIKDNVAIPNIGEKKYEKYMPFLLTVFFFILINNLMGLVPFFPGGANLTGNISVTFTLAAIVLIIVIVTSNKHYWQHILAMPGVPKPVLFILTPIEILGFIIRPFVLMMRLFANITAGHIVILSFISLIFIFGAMSAGAGYGISIFSMSLVVFMSLLELLVAFLQAYVFTLLSAIYFGSAIEEGHHEGEHH
ncbi:MAG: F0F1 ATP synthase subunit A [Chitinophagales bacterium]|nr:F0F1 ATP synthase subunit A [Chitinophagales bacterium]